MSFASRLGIVAGLAGAAVVIYAQRRSQKTGRDLVEVLLNLPQELKETKAELQVQLMAALDKGRQAAAQKEAEIDRELKEAEGGTSHPPDKGYDSYGFDAF